MVAEKVLVWVRKFVSVVLVLAVLQFASAANIVLAQQSPAPSPVELDLSSAERSVPAAQHGAFGSANVNLGGTVRSVTVDSMLTAAEHVALSQILMSGQQSLQLSELGRAIGGQVNLTALAGTIASLVLPQNVTGVHDFARTGFSLPGNLVNFGTLFAVSSNRNVSSGTIAAANIFNHSGALLSSVIPPMVTLPVASVVPNLNLNLSAAQEIVNEGTISSAGQLAMGAGSSITNRSINGTTAIIQAVSNISVNSAVVNNSGLLSSLQKDVLFSTPPGTNLFVNNVGGRIEAQKGAINFRETNFAGKFSTSSLGGDLIAREINFNGGQGLVAISVNELLGTVNARAHELFLRTNTPSLELGKIALTGDPTIANSLGDIVLSSSLNFPGQNLAILAKGNISAVPSVKSITLPTSQNMGGTIYILAGVEISPESSDPSPNVDITYTVTGPSDTGGSVMLPGVSINTSNTAPGETGGFVTIGAYKGSASGGNIAVGTIKTSSRESSGQVQIFGAGSIQIGGINATSITSQGGEVKVIGASPEIGPTGLRFLNGTLQQGFVTAGTLDPNSSVSIGSIDTSSAMETGGQIDISAGQRISVTGSVNASAKGRELGWGANVNLMSSGNIEVLGGIFSTAGTPHSGLGGNITVLTTGGLVNIPKGITTSGGKVTVSTSDGDITLGAISTAHSSDFADADVNISTTSGAIKLSSINTSPKISESHSGKIQITNQFGDILISGSLNASALTAGSAARPLTIETETGGIKVIGSVSTASSAAASSLLVQTQTGDVTFSNSIDTSSQTNKGGKVTVTTSGGSIAVKSITTSGRLYILDPLSFATGGDVTLTTAGSGLIVANGAITTSAPGDAGKITITSDDGDILLKGTLAADSVANQSGDIAVASSSGDISLGGAQASGGFLLRPGWSPFVGSGGSINVQTDAGGKILVSGNLSVQANGQGPSVSLKTSAGELRVSRIINTSSKRFFGGNVSLSSDTGDIFLAGAKTDGSQHTVDNAIYIGDAGGINLSTSANGNISISGSLTATAPGNGGAVAIQAERGEIFAAAITTSAASVAGSISLNSEGLLIRTGTLNAAGRNALHDFDPSGGGGDVTISGASVIQVKGGIFTNAGRQNGFFGDGGNAGDILIQTAQNQYPGGAPGHIGSIEISGSIVSRGGVGGFDSVGGENANITLRGGVVRLLGAGTSIDNAWGYGFSVDEEFNVELVFAETQKSLTIETFGFQPIPANFDLTSTKKTEYAVPGGMFTFGAAPVINGAAGRFVIGPFFPVTKQQIPAVIASAPFDFPDFPDLRIIPHIDTASVDGVSAPIFVADESGKRVMVTPSVALALYQVTRSNAADPQTFGLDPSGIATFTNPSTGTGPSVLTLMERDLYPQFTNFKLPGGSSTATIELILDGQQPTLDLTKSATVSIAGTLTMTESVVNATLNLGAKQLNLTPTGKLIVLADGSSMTLRGTAPTWSLAGSLSGNDFYIDHPGKVLNLQVGPLAMIGSETTNLHLTPATKMINVISNGGVIGATFAFDSIASPSTPLKLNFQYLSADVGVARVSGNLSGSTVEVRVKPHAQTKFAGAALEIISGSSITSTSATLIDAAGGSLTVGDGVSITSGVLKVSDDGTAPLPAGAVKTAGKLTLMGGGLGGDITVGEGTQLIANGGNVLVSNLAGDIFLGAQSSLKSNGGNVQVLGMGAVSGTECSITARSVGSGKSSVGGGVEIASGLAASTSLAKTFALPKGTVATGGHSLGNNVEIDNGGTGAIQVIGPLEATVDLSTGLQPSKLELNGGAILFNAPTAESSITFDGITITVASTKLVSFVSRGAAAATQDGQSRLDGPVLANVYDEQCNASVIPDCDDRNLILTGRGAILVEAVEDVKIATDFATVSLKKGGLICIDSSTSSVRIKACSGPGHVSILSGPRKLDMLPGQELFLCDYIPNEEHKLPADGIGRRKLQMFSLNSKIQAVLCDYSVVTLIASRRAAFEAGLANRQYKRNIESKLLKTAAVIDQVTRKRGIYKAAL